MVLAAAILGVVVCARRNPEASAGSATGASSAAGGQAASAPVPMPSRDEIIAEFKKASTGKSEKSMLKALAKYNRY